MVYVVGKVARALKQGEWLKFIPALMGSGSGGGGMVGDNDCEDDSLVGFRK